MRLKRLAISIVLTCLVLILASCGAPSPPPGPPSSTPTPAPPTPPPREEELKVHFIDVGQGDSILIDSGETEILIDGGDRSADVVPYLDKYVDGEIEAMVATHPHTDHIGGLIGVLAHFDVDSIWLNGDTSTSRTYGEFMSAVNAEGTQIQVAKRGDQIKAGPLVLDVLNPTDPPLGSTNNKSIVLFLSFGDTDFLFTGDAEAEAEASMLAAHLISGVEVLKVGHHGSRTASSKQFIVAAQPEVAIYMAGEGNSYGHPHQETIATLDEFGAEVYGTDVHGTIIVVTNGTTYNVQPTKIIPSVVPAGTRELTIGVDGQGTTTPSPASYTYNEGTQVTITATPASGWRFDHWGGDASGTSTTVIITMNSNKNITAYFSQLPPTQYTLTINVSGQGTTNPSPGTYTYDKGIQVSIIATPASGWRFDHWGGDVSGSSPTFVITIDCNKSVTAYFEQVTTIGSNVQITKIFYDGLVYRVESDEYVEITNLGSEPQDLAGWVLKDISEGYPSFTFPHYVLTPGAAIRVYTNEIHPEWGGFSFGYGKAIWNNTNPDVAALYNAQGQEVSRKSY
jgi:beta-lactamase superfamily II metal-dependent hydrolase